MLINNADIRTYCKLGYNVANADIYIEEAQDEFEAKISDTLFSRFEVVNTYIAWAIATAYVVGNYVTYSGSLWKCLVNNTGSTPAAGNANWGVQEIYVGFLIAQKHLALASYSKFLEEHGFEVQGDGVVKYNGAESQIAVTPQERADMVNRYRNRGDAHFTKFMKWIDDLNYEVDSVSYPFTDTDIVTHQDKFGIF